MEHTQAKQLETIWPIEYLVGEPTHNRHVLYRFGPSGTTSAPVSGRLVTELKEHAIPIKDETRFGQTMAWRIPMATSFVHTLSDVLYDRPDIVTVTEWMNTTGVTIIHNPQPNIRDFKMTFPDGSILEDIEDIMTEIGLATGEAENPAVVAKWLHDDLDPIPAELLPGDPPRPPDMAIGSFILDLAMAVRNSGVGVPTQQFFLDVVMPWAEVQSDKADEGALADAIAAYYSK